MSYLHFNDKNESDIIGESLLIGSAPKTLDLPRIENLKKFPPRKNIVQNCTAR